MIETLAMSSMCCHFSVRYIFNQNPKCENQSSEWQKENSDSATKKSNSVNKSAVLLLGYTFRTIYSKIIHFKPSFNSEDHVMMIAFLFIELTLCLKD